MSDFKAKMHQIVCRLGLRPRPAGGAYSTPPDPQLEYSGPTSKGRGRDERGREGKGRQGRGEKREGRDGEGWEREGAGSAPKLKLAPPQNYCGKAHCYLLHSTHPYNLLIYHPNHVKLLCTMTQTIFIHQIFHIITITIFNHKITTPLSHTYF